MSTPSRIGLEYPDGRVQSIYVHFDGYPDTMSKILPRLRAPEQVRAILDLGNLSSIDHEPDDGEIATGAVAACAYARDRGEKLADNLPVWSEDVAAFARLVGDESLNYQYVWRGGRWYGSRGGRTPANLCPIEELKDAVTLTFPPSLAGGSTDAAISDLRDERD